MLDRPDPYQSPESRTSSVLAAVANVRWSAQGPDRRTWSTTDSSSGAKAVWLGTRHRRSWHWWRPATNIRDYQSSPIKESWPDLRQLIETEALACAVHPSTAAPSAELDAQGPWRTFWGRDLCSARLWPLVARSAQSSLNRPSPA